MPQKILIIAGEASGDLHGAYLVKSLKKQIPQAQFFGMGGAKMLEAGVKIVYPIGDLAIIGISGVIMQLGKIKKLFGIMKEQLDELKPDLVILIDYPGFNLRFAKIAKKAGIPVIYYISPQVWVWGKSRIRTIKRNVDKMLVLFKFEEDLYKKHGVPAEFVGHPIVDIVKPSSPRQELKTEFGVPDGKVIALLPASRSSELKKVFPVMLESFKKIHAQFKDTTLLIAKYKGLPNQAYEAVLKGFDFPYKLVDGRPYDCVEASDMVIATSGSATLETAILEKPMIITYKVSVLTGICFLLLVRVKYVGLPNIIAGKEIMPELLQYSATPGKIAREAMRMLSDPERLNQMKYELEKVKKILGPPGASDRAATAITKFLSTQS